MENILLRFRDTGDLDTISVHQELIEKNGYVWWGWWKKDSEPDRGNKLEQIKDTLDQVNFYLFDRSTERFFVIQILKIHFDKNRKISSPEKDKTPTYYQNESLVLWLQIEKISSITLVEFTEVFNIIPNNDYTFFTGEDVQQELKEFGHKVRKIKLKSDYIMHLSDIHFGADFGFPFVNSPAKRPLLNIIVDFVNNDLKKTIGLLVISGDITSRGDSNHLLNHGLSFLNDLCNALKIDKECVVIIPGNHDIPLQDANFSDYSHENSFRVFLENFYGSKKELFGLEFFEFPCGKTVDILRINSVKLRKKEESNYGYVDWFHYKNLLEANKLNGALKIAVIHHHLVSMPIEEALDPKYAYGSISVTIDSGRVIEGLQKYGFDFVLNGHQHIPGITKITRGTIDNDNKMDFAKRKQLNILSAGSAGVKSERFSEEMRYNSFSIYLIKTNSLEIEVKTYNPTVEPRRHYFAEVTF
jgi:predicted MPP superfamily phosphohydrolase